MKLIDLLVQELPKRGGWKFGRNAVYQDWDGELRIDSEYNSSTKILLPLSEIVRERAKMKHSLPDHAFVTREQYEAALAASPWNGEGLPPVGAECECMVTFNWFRCKIMYISEKCAVIQHGESEEVWSTPAVKFRPIRTEAERQREEAIDTIANLCHRGDPGDDATAIYDAITAHKIPGVALVPTVSQIVRVTEKCSREDAERIITMLTGGTITE